jgi:pimeloyl-ACP methyl ester carboxylesterase
MAAAIIQTTPRLQGQPAPNQQTTRAHAPEEQGRTIDLRPRDGGLQRVLYLSPAKPVGSIVMLPGGVGDIGVEEDSGIRHGNNFVVRTRGLWVQRGYAVVIPDTIDRTNLRGDRSTPQYAALVVQLAELARSQAPAPVFLLGTSQGSIAAMNGAANAPAGLVSGLILTESVSRIGGSGETVFSASPEKVRVPALVVANRADRCKVAPPDDAPRIAAALKNSPDVHIEFVDGGSTRSRMPCGSLTPHGYYGLEPEVVAMIARWMDNHR